MTGNPKAAAAAFREEHGLGVAPIRDLIGLLEDHPGVDVGVMEMPTWLEGMTMKHPDTGVALIAVNTNRTPERQRFSLAHELGHLELNELAEGVPNHARDAAEIRADKFAQELLIPSEGVSKALEERGRRRLELTPEDLSEVVREFGVSPTAARIQLHSSRWIDQRTKDEWSIWSAPRLATRFGWSAERDALVRASLTEQPFKRILANATEGYLRGLLPITSVARASGMQDVDAIRSQLEDSELRPEAPMHAGHGVIYADLDALGKEA